MKTILAPVDFSRVSRQVVEESTALALALGAALEILHVIAPPVNIVTYDLPANAFVKEIEYAQEQALRKLGELRRLADARGVSCTTKLAQGPAVAAILDEARALPASHIVMGSHGHGALYELLAGSTTHGVLHRAPCPVLVLPESSATES
jgi:nucleotide-binding universal stress UspA family protein